MCLLLFVKILIEYIYNLLKKNLFRSYNFKLSYTLIKGFLFLFLFF